MKKNTKKEIFLRISSKKMFMIIILLIIMLNIILIPINSLAASTYTQEVKTGIENFPKEYQTYLTKLHEQHPNWSFDAYYTGISWEELLQNETNHGHNRIIKSAQDSWKCSCGDIASGYACASSGIIAYYLDPRNFLDDVSIFQFLEISYNENVHKLAGVEKSLKNTFLDKTITFELNGEQKTMSYAQIILDAAKESNMSPYSIRTKIIQEVGSKGSNSVSGTYPGYEGYYNFFNYGAYDEGNSAIANGLKKARELGWNNPYTAIVEGAKLLSNSYTNAGQNTAYFYKWDVVGNRVLKSGETASYGKSYFFGHQYMTNVQDPKSQSSSLFNLYASIGIIEENLNFVIPVYNNMPSTVTGLPSNIVENDDTLIYYVTDPDGINVRNAPTTSGEKICAIPKDTKVIVLEKNCADSDGYIWFKIKLENGTEGYVASNYIAYYSGKDYDALEPNEPVNPTPTEPTEPTKKAEINEEKSEINTIPETDGKTIAEELKIEDYTVTDAQGNKIENDDQVGTGYKIIDNKTEKEYTVIKKGDVNGDAEINSGDLLVTRKYLLKDKEINDNNYLQALDMNNDGEINSGDLLKIRKYLLRDTQITI